MRTVNILIPELTDQNIRAFVAPMIAARRRIEDLGLKLHYHHAAGPSLADCDVLILCSSYWRGPWQKHREKAVAQFAAWSEQVPVTLLFDRSSTTGTVQRDVMPFVRRYYKTSLLRDRSHYLRSLYGQRLFADYYHREFAVEDEEPILVPALREQSELDKLRVSWSTALADYSLFGPRRSALYRYLRWDGLMSASTRFHAPDASRPVDVSCRMGMRYRHETVAYQRRRMAEILDRYKRNDRVSKSKYFSELRSSKIVASPFGYGEINYKDFETFLSGALLLKPDMSHLETYPDLYEDGVTYVAHRWDLADVQEKIDSLLRDERTRLEISTAGQERYRSATAGRAARESFARYFGGLLDEACEEPAARLRRSS